MRASKRLVRVAAALAARAEERDRPRVVVYLPRKDGDTRPPGVEATVGPALLVRCVPGQPDPPLPAGW